MMSDNAGQCIGVLVLARTRSIMPMIAMSNEATDMRDGRGAEIFCNFWRRGAGNPDVLHTLLSAHCPYTSAWTVKQAPLALLEKYSQHIGKGQCRLDGVNPNIV